MENQIEGPVVAGVCDELLDPLLECFFGKILALSKVVMLSKESLRDVATRKELYCTSLLFGT